MKTKDMKGRKTKLFMVPHMGGAAVARADKKLVLEAAKEKQRHIEITQRAIDASIFLPIHGFMTERQARSLVSQIRKYLWEHKLIIVEKAWKHYVVLPDDAYVRPKWRLVAGTSTRKKKVMQDNDGPICNG